MADLDRALKLMKSLDLAQLERQDQIEMQEVILILETMVAGGEDTAEQPEPETQEPETQEPDFAPQTGDEPPGAVEVETDSSEVTVDSVMEEKLEEATKEALKDEPK